MSPDIYYVDKKFDITSFFSSFVFNWSDDFVFSGESHEAWEVVYVSEGCVEVTEDERIYRLYRGDMVLHAPWEFHRIRSGEGSFPKGMIMSFIANGELPTELKNGVFHLNDELFDEYRKTFSLIYTLMHESVNSVYSGLEATAMLSSFLIHLSANPSHDLPPLSTASAKEYKKAIFAMTEGVCKNLTLDDIAKICNVSLSYLKLLFRKHAGISPKNYYAQLRMRQACEFLKGGMNVTDTADAMNFSSPNYFCVFFKRHIGISPFEYQKRSN